jgi:hypothetical protein
LKSVWNQSIDSVEAGLCQVHRNAATHVADTENEDGGHGEISAEDE